MGGTLLTTSLDPPPNVNVTDVDINPADFLVQSLASDSQEIESSMPSPQAVQPPFILEDLPDYETEHEDVIRFQQTHVHQELEPSMQSDENELPNIENEDPDDAVFQPSPVIGFTKRSAQTPIARANKVPKLAVPSNGNQPPVRTTPDQIIRLAIYKKKRRNDSGTSAIYDKDFRNYPKATTFHFNYVGHISHDEFFASVKSTTSAIHYDDCG